jgi:hypothetical protein
MPSGKCSSSFLSRILSFSKWLNTLSQVASSDALCSSCLRPAPLAEIDSPESAVNAPPAVCIGFATHQGAVEHMAVKEVAFLISQVGPWAPIA